MIQSAYLLDTCVVIDSMRSAARLPAAIAAILTNTQNLIYVSDVSLWEIGIKMHKGKLGVENYTFEQIVRVMQEQEYSFLPIGRAEILQAVTLPRHHDDPFDRLMIAQALQHDMVLISPDKIFSAYTPNILW